MEAIFAACAETGTLIELNASPERLDLNDLHARRAGCGLYAGDFLLTRIIHRC
ncbi:MAG: hypothetical protein U0559_14235 [Anaerolineae bacterium]